jgi:hypothetical protein
MNTDEDFSDEGDETEPQQFIPEQVRPPADAYEWYECVVTEIAWKTGRTLFLTTPVNVVLQSMVNRGMEPEKAADYIIEKWNLAAA